MNRELTTAVELALHADSAHHRKVNAENVTAIAARSQAYALIAIATTLDHLLTAVENLTQTVKS